MDKTMIVKNVHGLCVTFLENGILQSIEAKSIRISLKAATIFSRYGANIYLRKRDQSIEHIPLTGPLSHSRFNISGKGFFASGSWGGVDYKCVLRLSEKSLSWMWGIELKNISGEILELDLICVQDIGLKQISSGPVNEYYVAQYLERRILYDKNHGPVLCCRQNTKEADGNPWLMMACNNGALAASTDGMQFYGSTFRENGVPEGLLGDTLTGEYAGESSVVALQEMPFMLSPGQIHTSSFVVTYLPDHPGATADRDLKMLPRIFYEFGNGTPSQSMGLHPSAWDSIPVHGTPSQFKPSFPNPFCNSPFLPAEDLNEEEMKLFFGNEKRHEESESGRLLSFFSRGNNHVVFKAKELLTDRPHAHILQTGTGLVPDEKIMSTTCFAFGVFNSHLTQGNTNFNTLLSVCTSQFNQAPETGQRIIVSIKDRQFLLGIPSAFEMGLNHCRWIYKFGEHCFQVRTWTSKKAPQVNMDFMVLDGPPVNLLITHDFDPLNGWTAKTGGETGEFILRPNQNSMLAGKFPRARFRGILQDQYTDIEFKGMESQGGGWSPCL
jgi:hypothetical protein